MVSRKPGKVEFPTLFVAHDWAEAHCVAPDGLGKGTPWEFYEWQSWCLLNFYRLQPKAKLGQKAPAFKYRRSQIIGPQKLGKAPYSAAHICVEAVGPALFNGWAEGGEVWDCRDFGCGCGWVYEYEPGEGMGRPWPSALIQITAYSEDQTDNIYDALKPMIDGGPLSQLIPKTGEEFIRLPNDGRIDIVTSNAKSRLGQRVTFVPQDETSIWTPAANMITVAETQRRGLAGMGGRAEETSNAWDPGEGSVAQRTAEDDMPDVFRYHVLPPKGLNYAVKSERRKIHKAVYIGTPHIDLDAIEGEAQEILIRDPHQTERFFGNRVVAGADKAFDAEKFEALSHPDRRIKSGRLIVLGFDGAKKRDTTALVATDVESGFQQVMGFWERPTDVSIDDWEVPTDEVNQAVDDVFRGNKFDVWRMYADPPYWQTELNEWAGLYGEDKVVRWWTNRLKAMAFATQDYCAAIESGALTHDGDLAYIDHVGNAVKQTTKMRDPESGDFLWYPRKQSADSALKIDIAMAGIISWIARGDCIKTGAANKPKVRSARF